MFDILQTKSNQTTNPTYQTKSNLAKFTVPNKTHQTKPKLLVKACVRSAFGNVSSTCHCCRGSLLRRPCWPTPSNPAGQSPAHNDHIGRSNKIKYDMIKYDMICRACSQRLWSESCCQSVWWLFLIMKIVLNLCSWRLWCSCWWSQCSQQPRSLKCQWRQSEDKVKTK